MGVDRCGGVVDDGVQAETLNATFSFTNNALAPYTLLILLPQMLQFSKNLFFETTIFC
jgi:hypothetical protein